MKGLLAKEWCVIYKTGAFMLIVILLFAVIGAYSSLFSMFVYVALMLGIIPVNYMALDESSGWHQYALTMPCARRTIVSAKYVIMLILAAAATAITAAGLFIGMRKQGVFSAEIYAVYLTVTLVMGVLLPSIAFPFNFKFGTAKGRLAMVIMCCSLAGFMGAWFNTYYDGNAAVHLERLSVSAAIPIVLLAVALLCALSWRISVRVYENKDL